MATDPSNSFKNPKIHLNFKEIFNILSWKFDILLKKEIFCEHLLKSYFDLFITLSDCHYKLLKYTKPNYEDFSSNTFSNIQK